MGEGSTRWYARAATQNVLDMGRGQVSQLGGSTHSGRRGKLGDVTFGDTHIEVKGEYAREHMYKRPNSVPAMIHSGCCLEHHHATCFVVCAYVVNIPLL